MGFSRQEYWSGLTCPPPGDLPDPRIESTSLMFLHWQVDSLTLVPPGNLQIRRVYCYPQCIDEEIDTWTIQMAFRGHRDNSRTETSKDFFALLDLAASLCIRKLFFPQMLHCIEFIFSNLYNWQVKCIYLKCTTWLFDVCILVMHCKIVTKTKLIKTFITLHSCLFCLCVCMCVCFQENFQFGTFFWHTLLSLLKLTLATQETNSE